MDNVQLSEIKLNDRAIIIKNIVENSPKNLFLLSKIVSEFEIIAKSKNIKPTKKRMIHYILRNVLSYIIDSKNYQ